MTEAPLRRQWWLAAVAAVLAGLLMYDAIGPRAGAALVVLVLAGFGGYRFLRARKAASIPEIYCLKCGEKLSATARQCRHCGSASWSYKN